MDLPVRPISVANSALILGQIGTMPSLPILNPGVWYKSQLAALSSLPQGDLASLYIKAGVKNVGTVFLMTDAQVADEKFLVLVNDLLASGNGRPPLITVSCYRQGGRKCPGFAAAANRCLAFLRRRRSSASVFHCEELPAAVEASGFMLRSASVNVHPSIGHQL